MKLVKSADEFLEQLASAKREAMSSFGDEIVLLEKYITRPRHIELQVFGDTKVREGVWRRCWIDA